MSFLVAFVICWLMADVFPSYHGGDGSGNDPPRQPFRQGSGHADSGPAKPPRRLRGKSILASADKCRRKYGNSKIPLTWSRVDNCWRPVNLDGKHFSRVIGHTIRGNFPLHHHSIFDCDESLIHLMWRVLQDYFDFAPHRQDPHWYSHIVPSIYHIMQNTYWDSKYEIRRKWLKKGVFPEKFTEEDTKNMLDHWDSDEFKNRSNVAKGNQKKSGPPSGSGSATYSRIRDMLTWGDEVVPGVPKPLVGKELPDFYDIVGKKAGQWRCTRFKNNKEKFNQLFDQHTQSTPGQRPTKEKTIEIMKDAALATQSPKKGWLVAIGPCKDKGKGKEKTPPPPLTPLGHSGNPDIPTREELAHTMCAMNDFLARSGMPPLDRGPTNGATPSTATQRDLTRADLHEMMARVSHAMRRIDGDPSVYIPMSSQTPPTPTDSSAYVPMPPPRADSVYVPMPPDEGDDPASPT